MNAQTKKSCFTEISHLICDCDKKVNINDISNNWNLSFRDSESVLLEWLESQKTRVLTKEYLIRGVDKSDRCFISVVPERRLASLEKHFPKFCSSLYSLELPSESNRLNNVELSKTNHIRLPLEGQTRACKVLPINIPIVKPDAVNVKAEASTPIAQKKPVSTMFAAKPASKSEEKPKPQPDKQESAATVKTETKTPKKESPKKKGPKATNVHMGKSSISSFFSAKPAATKSSEPIATKSENVSGKGPKENSSDIEKEEQQREEMSVPSKIDISPKEKPSKKNVEKKDNQEVEKKSSKEKPSKKSVEKTEVKKVTLERDDKVSNKRSFVEVEDSDDEVIMGTPQDTKKARKVLVSKKKKKTPTNKHSRIRQIVDSSDSDEEMAETKPDSLPPSPECVKEVPKIDINKRRRAKRTITRTYQDDDGYLITAKEIEEYSCSDEDDVAVEAEVKPVTSIPIKSDPMKKNGPTSNGVDKEKTPKKVKKITPPKPGTKQGSILNFFNKK